MKQDLYECTRFPLFKSNIPSWPIYTNGGTLLLVKFENRYFGLAPAHILSDNPPDPAEAGNILIKCRNREPSGSELAVRQALTLNSIDSELPDEHPDLSDLFVTEFYPPKTELVHAYYWEKNTWGDAEESDPLITVGYLKDRSDLSFNGSETVTIAQPSKFRVYHRIQPGDDSGSARAIGQVPLEVMNDVGNLRGMSGAVVFNERQRKVSGIVLRGGYNAETRVLSFRYLAASLIDQYLQSVINADSNFSVTVKEF